MQNTNATEHTHLKHNPFRVPHGYFDLLPQRTGQKIVQMSTQEAHDMSLGFSFRKQIIPQLALAASFVLMIGLGFGIVRLATPNLSDTDIFDPDHLSVFKTYTLLQNDEWEETLDSEQIIIFLTEHGISPYAIAALD
jgi:hypothetical protein